MGSKCYIEIDVVKKRLKWIFGALVLFLIFNYFTTKTPILPGRIYFHDNLGQTFYRDCKGPAPICSYKYHKLDADWYTFHVLMENSFAADNKHVFWENQILKDADPKTFRVLTQEFGKDYRLYYFKQFHFGEYLRKQFNYADSIIPDTVEPIVSITNSEFIIKIGSRYYHAKTETSPNFMREIPKSQILMSGGYEIKP